MIDIVKLNDELARIMSKAEAGGAVLVLMDGGGKADWVAMQPAECRDPSMRTLLNTLADLYCGRECDKCGVKFDADDIEFKTMFKCWANGCGRVLCQRCAPDDGDCPFCASIGMLEETPDDP